MTTNGLASKLVPVRQAKLAHRSEKVILGLTSDLVASNGVLAFPDYPLHALAGFEDLVIVHLDVSNGHDPAELADLDLLISVPHGAPLDRAALAQAQRLAAVIRVGVGFEDCDLPVLTSGGTALVLPTQATRRPTAVAALTLILALATRLLDKHRITLAGPGLWEERAEFRGVDVRGKLLGLVGCGAIGRELIAIARPLGFSLAIYDPGLAADDAAALGAVPLALEELLARSDFVSIHCPLTPETRHLINAPRLALMKPTAFLVNTARGGVIDQAALVRALIGHAIAGAGLDVFEPEPLPADDLLLQSPNVLFSAHALNWTRELDAELGHTNIEAVASLLKGKDPGVLANPGVLKDQTFRDKLARIAALSAAARNSDIPKTAKAIPGTGGPTR